MTENTPSSSLTDLSEILRLRAQVFDATPLRRRLSRILGDLLGRTAGQQVLVMTADEAMTTALISSGEAAEATEWSAVAEDSTRAELLKGLGLSHVATAEPLPNLPFAEASFDAAVLSHVLEYTVRPEEFMARLHAVLRPKTRLILHVRRRRHSLAGLFRRWAGMVDPARPPVRAGFTPAELFDVIKDGFDVQETVAYGRFFSELTELLAELFAGMVPDSCEEASLQMHRLNRARWVYRFFTPLFWMAAVGDAMCFFLPCHHMVIRAKRRMLWVPRVTPRLRDGRSIAEAALGSKIGTAVE